ncbi:acetyl-CoA carboxylase biotin carboxyl carrier protein subunit [Trebonia kvetii]|uniref:Biotin carboxyl carrier protein of acetyl-CoA carboxylase n=1 Tax=Trebonia kvetii TaxID=2480626 RepID=A0A6P2C3Z2_9ACTN|nr:biotin/lipoyl-containing protein [Trebonia kvetii]TVZ05215.1 acetyl-CoA carboxylase biotin carboxyl carrier protein subunit [Trebonia kvetii]
MDLSNDDVAEILALLDSLPYDELDVETPRFRLTLRRAPGGGWTEESQVRAEPVVAEAASRARAAGASAAAADATAAASGAAAGPAGGDAAGEDGRDGLVAVTAPLPGTFYRAPRPGADPYVREGDAVSPDTVVAIVETMKLMNSVHAGTAGRVARICADNGEFTPLGTTLLLIEPDT